MASGWIDEASVGVHVLFGKAKVNKIDSIFVVTRAPHHEVRRLYVSMNQASLVHIFDRSQHLQQQIDCVYALELPWMALLERGEVLTLKLHDDEILLTSLLLINEVMNLDDALEAS